MNYGHPLRFGLEARSGTPDADVATLSRHAEALSYDFVALADTAPTDPWTLATWIAGTVPAIRLLATVTVSSSFLPAVLARQAASLDLLSGGRAELLLDASGASAEALAETITILRAMWQAEDPVPVRHGGEHFTVYGAQAGPLPNRAIRIWVQGDTPEVLAVTGRLADGWVAHVREERLDQLCAQQAAIDAAATAAGRDPREIQRLARVTGTLAPTRDGFLHGTPAEWVDDLIPLVRDHGFSAIALGVVDADDAERFSTLVIPPLRQAARALLPALSARNLLRPAAVRQLRRPGIAYDDVPESILDITVEPGDLEYARVHSTYMRGGSPGIVFRTRTVDEVIAALAFAREHADRPLGIRSGGHGISGRSTNRDGIVIDLGRMNAIDVIDEAKRLVRIGPGARWKDVARALDPYGWAITSGDYGGVGVGGLATAGGIGFMARQHGLTIDHLRAVEMVLADGTVVRASNEQHPDLFWAVRGAGANFGIVTAFELEADPVGNVGWAQFILDASDLAGVLQSWGTVIEAAPRELSGQILIGAPRPGEPLIAQVMALVNSGEPDFLVDTLTPLIRIAPVYDQSVVLTRYANVMANAQDTGYHRGRGEPIAHNGLVTHITPEFATATERLLRSGAVPFFQIRTVGGAVADVAPEATAYGYRSANFQVTAIGANRRRLDAEWDLLRPHFEGMYLSFETDRGAERLHDAFPPATLRRLRELKTVYDPQNVFADNFTIAPQPVLSQHIAG